MQEAGLLIDEESLHHDDDNLIGRLDLYDNDVNNVADNFDIDEMVALPTAPGWQFDSSIYPNVSISIDDVAQKILSQASSEILAVQGNLQRNIGINISFEDIFSTFFNNSSWFMEFVNRLRYKSRASNCELRDQEEYSFLEYLLICSFYGKTSSFIENHPHYFTQPKMKQARFLQLCGCFSISTDEVAEESGGHEWGAVGSAGVCFNNASRQFSELCSKICLTRHTDMCIDDDKVSHGSPELSKYMGIALNYHKGESKGLTIYANCSAPLGLVLAIYPKRTNDTTDDCIKTVLKRSMNQEVFERINLENRGLFVDRELMSVAFIDMIHKIHGRVTGTLARNKGFPLTYNSSSTSAKATAAASSSSSSSLPNAAADRQHKISIEGSAAVYTAVRHQTSSNYAMTAIHQVVYRTGTGNVVMFATTDPSLAGDRWTLETYTPQPLRLYHVYNIGFVEELNITPEAAWNNVLTHINADNPLEIREITAAQGGVEYFAARRFTLTALSAFNAVSCLHAYFAAIKQTFTEALVALPLIGMEEECLRIDSDSSNVSKFIEILHSALDLLYEKRASEEQSHVPTSYTSEYLWKLTFNDLVAMCKENKLPHSAGTVSLNYY